VADTKKPLTEEQEYQLAWRKKLGEAYRDVNHGRDTATVKEPEGGEAMLNEMGVPDYKIPKHSQGAGKADPSLADKAPAKVEQPVPARAEAAQDAPVASKDEGGIPVHFLKNGRVPLIRQDGEVFSAPKETAYDAISKHGYKPITPDEYDQLTYHEEIKKKYGTGAANKAAAFGTGVLNGLAFDAGDAGLVKAGVSKDRIRAYRENLEGYRGTGEAAGLLGSMLIPGGAEVKAAEGLEKGAAAAEGGSKLLKSAEAASKALKAGEETKALAEGASQKLLGAGTKELPETPAAFKGLVEDGGAGERKLLGPGEPAPEQAPKAGVVSQTRPQRGAPVSYTPDAEGALEEAASNVTSEARAPRRVESFTPQRALEEMPPEQAPKAGVVRQERPNRAPLEVQDEDILETLQPEKAGVISQGRVVKGRGKATPPEFVPAPGPEAQELYLKRKAAAEGTAKEAYESTVQQVGRKTADRVVERDPKSADLLHAATTEEATNAGGRGGRGKSLFREEGLLNEEDKARLAVENVDPNYDAISSVPAHQTSVNVPHVPIPTKPGVRSAIEEEAARDAFAEHAAKNPRHAFMYPDKRGPMSDAVREEIWPGLGKERPPIDPNNPFRAAARGEEGGVRQPIDINNPNKPGYDPKKVRYYSPGEAMERVPQAEAGAGGRGAGVPPNGPITPEVLPPEPAPRGGPGALPPEQEAINAKFSQTAPPAEPYAAPAPRDPLAAEAGFEPHLGAQPPVPGVPGAPGPSIAQRALGVATAPNRALFGMGKRVGSFVEEATGSKIAGHFAQGAAESVPFTLGSNTSDAIVNDEKVTAERLTAGIGVNALVGGTLAAGLGAAADGLHKLSLRIPEIGNPHAPKDQTELVKNVVSSLQQSGEGTRTELHQMYESGAKYQRIGQILGDSAKVVQEKPRAFVDLWGKTMAAAEKLPGATEAQRAVKQAAETLNAQIQAARTDAALFQAGDEFKRAVAPWIKREGLQNPATQEFQKTMRQMEAAWIQGLQDETLWGKAGNLQRNLNELVSNGIKLEGKGSGLNREFMRKGDLLDEDKLVFDDAKMMRFIENLHSDKPIQKVQAEHTQKVLREWMDNRRELTRFMKEEIYEPLGAKGKLDNLHDALGGNDAKLLNAYANDKLLTESQRRTLFQRVVADRGTRLGVSGAMMMAGVPHAFLLTYTVSYAIDRAIGIGLGSAGFEAALAEHGARFGKVISDGLSKAFEAGAKAAPATSVGVLGKMSFKADAKESPASRHEQAVHLAEQLHELSTDPQKLHDTIAGSTKSLQVAHPELALQVQLNTSRAVQYLASKAPKDPLPPSPFTSKAQWRPGHAEVARFETIAETVANPLVLVRDFANGSLTSEQVETANTVYPELTQHIQREAMNQLAQRKGEIPDYQKRLAFERLTGQKIDWASQSDAIAMLQKNMPQPAQPDPSKGGAANKKKASPPSKPEQGLAEQVSLDLQSGLARV
jgi:hypothetical protein